MKNFLIKNILLSIFFSQITLAKSTCTIELKIQGAIGAATYDYLERGYKKAKSEKCSALLLLINTPGGNLYSTRMIVKDIVNSDIPILCLVSPAGGHAGSAGAIILQACHVNGAVNTTNIGAATPITAAGKDLSKDLRKKMINDTVSWVKGLAKLRNRNVKFAQDIVEEAKSLTAEEAHKIKAIDVVVKNQDEFIKYCEDKKIFLNTEKEISIKIGTIKEYNPDFRHNLLQIIADPQFAYMLFMGSLALLYFEITHPGTMVPGVLGGIGLVFSLVALHKLNVWWGGVMLLLLGLSFMIAEAFLPSFGILGLGGIISFLVGSILLFDQEVVGYSLPIGLILSVTIFLSLIMFGIAWLAFSTRKVTKSGSCDEFIGMTGKVIKLDQTDKEKSFFKGQIEINGEIWKFKTNIVSSAISGKSIYINDEVKVIDFKGLTLIVKK